MPPGARAAGARHVLPSAAVSACAASAGPAGSAAPVARGGFLPDGVVNALLAGAALGADRERDAPCLVLCWGEGVRRPGERRAGDRAFLPGRGRPGERVFLPGERRVGDRAFLRARALLSRAGAVSAT